MPDPVMSHTFTYSGRSIEAKEIIEGVIERL